MAQNLRLRLCELLIKAFSVRSRLRTSNRRRQASYCADELEPRCLLTDAIPGILDPSAIFNNSSEPGPGDQLAQEAAAIQAAIENWGTPSPPPVFPPLPPLETVIGSDTEPPITGLGVLENAQLLNNVFGTEEGNPADAILLLPDDEEPKPSGLAIPFGPDGSGIFINASITSNFPIQPFNTEGTVTAGGILVYPVNGAITITAGGGIIINLSPDGNSVGGGGVIDFHF